MKIKLTLTAQEIDDLRSVIIQAEANADVMLDGGRIGGQVKQANSILRGIKIVEQIIKLSK